MAARDRTSRVLRLVKKQGRSPEFKTPIATDMFAPNHSGNVKTPANDGDIANKKYVDDQISGAVSGFTQGSVIFADASGNLDEDNANFFWDDSNDYLGLGTNSPSQPLDCLGTIRSFVDANAGGSGVPEIQVGNQNANQGRLGFQYRNAAAAGSPRGLFSFQPRKNDDSTSIELGQFEFNKKAAADSAHFYLKTKRDGSAAVESRITVDATTGAVIIGDSGVLQKDFYVYGGKAATPMIFCDGSADAVGLNNATPSALLHLRGDADTEAKQLITSNGSREFIAWAKDSSPYVHFGSNSNHDFFIVRNGSAWIGLVNSSGGVVHYQDFMVDNVNFDFFVDNSTGKSGFGTNAPDCKAHVFVASAGVVAAHGDAALCLEDSDNTALQILSGNTDWGYILFGDDGGTTQGTIEYGHVSDEMIIKTNNTSWITIPSTGNVDFMSTGGVKVPVGTTAQRVATQGMIRYNTTTSKFEGYTGAAWVDFH